MRYVYYLKCVRSHKTTAISHKTPNILVVCGSTLKNRLYAHC